MSLRRIALAVLISAPVAYGVYLWVWAILLEGAFEGLGVWIATPYVACARSMALGCVLTSGGGLPSPELADWWLSQLIIQQAVSP